MSTTLPVLENYGLVPQMPLAIDHQVSGTFGECRRMAYYRHILGRERIGEDRTALDWGSAMHSASEVYDVTHNLEAVFATIEEKLAENIEDRYGRTRGRMFEAFGEWLKFKEMNPMKIIRTEQPVLVRCVSGVSCPYYPDSEEGCGLEYGGRIDRIVEWQGMVGPFDLKTTVMDEQDPIVEYRPSHQFMGYVWAVSHLMNNHSWGIIVERIVTNKSKIKIGRFPVSFTRDNIREWVENEKYVQAELRNLYDNHAGNEAAWTQNYFRCAKPWPCSYRDACLSPRDAGFRYRWLRDNTQERRWDFRAPDGEKGEEVKHNA